MIVEAPTTPDPAPCDRRAAACVDGSEDQIEQLVLACQGGCGESFAQIVGLYQERIFNYLLRLTRSPHEAEDLTQETFLKAYRGLQRYARRYSFTTWLFTIAKRTAINHFRSNRHYEALPENDDFPSSGANPSDELASKDDQASLWALAGKLPPKQREALWLRYGEGLSVAEAAAVMRTRQIYLRVLLHRGRKQLAAWLNAKGKR